MYNISKKNYLEILSLSIRITFSSLIKDMMSQWKELADYDWLTCKKHLSFSVQTRVHDEANT